MWSTRLMWTFAALVLLFGLPLAVLEDGGVQKTFAGLSTLSLGAFALAMAYNGMATGSITIQFSKVRRSAQPRTFWAAVGLVAVAGAGVIVAGIWFLFFKD